MSIESLKQAIQIVGGQTAMARVLSRDGRPMVQANVWKWLNSPNPDLMPPAEYCPAIERATNGAVKCEDLRPDVEWSVLRCTCTDQKEAA
jgi:DNA-binding transcriptional regulator YdaS (Cro superfamily)